MDCPRCGTELTAYALPDTKSVAVVCDRCGFADVPASHRDELPPVESWDHAFERFERVVGSIRDGTQDVRTASVEVPTDRNDGSSEISLEESGVSVSAVLGSRPQTDTEKDQKSNSTDVADDDETSENSE
ncbi:hypothetical protein ACT3HL_15610 [Halobellus sp. GM3]